MSIPPQAVVPADPEPDAVCLADFELLAKARMRPEAWEYVSAGAADEISLRWNIEAYQRIRLNPRYLVDVSELDASIALFGQRFASPILLAPVAAQCLAHPEGELATARAAAATATTMVLSSFSNTSVEQVAATAPGNVWFQLYAQRDHGFTRHLVERAEGAGCRALCLTIDTPITGLRTREARAKVDISPLPNLDGMSPSGRDFFERGFADIFSGILDPRLTWKDVEWLRSCSNIPLVLKGVLNPEDAARAAESGVAAIIVSNHGARNLDTVPATIDALPRVVEKVAGRMPVLVDGGIRRGTDVLKALALGASAVLIGRPYVYGLGAAGEAGVAKVVRILTREFKMAMALTGRTSIAAIDRSVLWP